MRVPAPTSSGLPDLQGLCAPIAPWIRSLLEPLESLQLPLGLRIPLALLLVPLGLLLLGRLGDLIPAVRLLLDRLRELASRLWRLVLALLRELVWVNPDRRRTRHARWRRGRLDAPSAAERTLWRLVDLLMLPIDWLASLGLQRLLRSDPACEEKEERRRHEHAGLPRRLGWTLETHAGLPLALSALRLLLPRLWLPGVLWRRFLAADSYTDAFPIRGMLWVSLNADVREVLERPETFEVVYGPRMREVTRPVGPPADRDAPAAAGEHGNFLLGMQDTPRYWRDASNMRLVFRREDAEHCRVLAERVAETALRQALDRRTRQAPAGEPPRLNLPGDLVIPVVEALVNDYFGLAVPLRCPDPRPEDDGMETVMVDHGNRWLDALFHYIFYDLRGETSRAEGERAAPRVRVALQECIRRRRQQMENGVAPDADDVLSRCLRLQRSGTAGMDDESIRINLTGFLVGAMTPLINATCQVIAVLLARPHALNLAQKAAGEHQSETLKACVMEALRFWPGDPVIWRWTNGDSWIGAGSRRCPVPRGTLVMAWNASAMFDPALVSAPWAFRTDRPSGSYLHWGHGQHSCAGAYLNMAVIPGMLGPLLRLGMLERAPGTAGRPSREGSHGLTFRRFELLVRPMAGAELTSDGAGDQKRR